MRFALHFCMMIFSSSVMALDIVVGHIPISASCGIEADLSLEKKFDGLFIEDFILNSAHRSKDQNTKHNLINILRYNDRESSFSKLISAIALLSSVKPTDVSNSQAHFDLKDTINLAESLEKEKKSISIHAKVVVPENKGGQNCLAFEVVQLKLKNSKPFTFLPIRAQLGSSVVYYKKQDEPHEYFAPEYISSLSHNLGKGLWYEPKSEEHSLNLRLQGVGGTASRKGELHLQDTMAIVSELKPSRAYEGQISDRKSVDWKTNTAFDSERAHALLKFHIQCQSNSNFRQDVMLTCIKKNNLLLLETCRIRSKLFDFKGSCTMNASVFNTEVSSKADESSATPSDDSPTDASSSASRPGLFFLW